MSPKKPTPPDSAPVPLDLGKVRALTRPYDAARYLRTEEQREAYLEAARETGDPAFSAMAEATVARSRARGEDLSLSPEDQATFAEAILNLPPLAPALERALERRERFLGGDSTIHTQADHQATPREIEGLIAAQDESSEEGS